MGETINILKNETNSGIHITFVKMGLGRPELALLLTKQVRAQFVGVGLGMVCIMGGRFFSCLGRGK